MYRKNVASQYLYFALVNASTGAALTGATVAGKRGIDGAAQGSVTGTFTEDGSGQYHIALSQADTNGNDIGFLFTASNAIPVSISIVTTAADPTDSVRFGLTALPNAAAGASGGLPLSVDASGRVDVLKINGTSQTARDIGASVLLSTGTGTGQLDFTSGVVKANAVQLLGTAWLTPGTAGTPDVNAKLIGATAQTGRDIGASVLLSSGTGTGQLDFTSGVVKANLAQILGTALTETAGLLAAGFKQFFNISSPTSTMNLITAVTTATSVTNRVTANTDQLAGQTVTAAAGVTFPTSVASPTNITAGTITTATNLTNAPTSGDFTTAMKSSLNAATPVASLSAAAIQAIWDALTSALTTAGSIGKLLVDNVNATIGSRLPTASISLSAGAVTVGTNNDKTGYALTSAYDPAKTAAQAGDAMALTSGERTTLTAVIWAALTSGLTTAGSIGKWILDKLDVVVSTRLASSSYTAPPSAATNAAAVWDEPLSGHTTSGSAGAALTAASSAGDPWATAVPGAYGAGTAGKILGDNLNATVSSRSTYAGGAVASVTAPVALTSAYDAAKTAAQSGDQMNLVNAPNATAITAIQSGLATSSAVAALPTATQNAQAVLKEDWTTVTGEAARSLLNAARANRNRVVIAGGVMTVYKEDGTTAAWSAPVTFDPTAEPIVAVTP